MGANVAHPLRAYRQIGVAVEIVVYRRHASTVSQRMKQDKDADA